jgi:hypothetical protein
MSRLIRLYDVIYRVYCHLRRPDDVDARLLNGMAMILIMIMTMMMLVMVQRVRVLIIRVIVVFNVCAVTMVLFLINHHIVDYSLIIQFLQLAGAHIVISQRRL